MAWGRSSGRDKYEKRDKITLAEVQQSNLRMVLECQGCGHKRAMDVNALLEKWPPETTMRKMAQVARCKNYGCRGRSGAKVLFCLGPRLDDWWPSVPLIRGRG